MSNKEENEIYKMLIEFNSEDIAKELFDCIYQYMATTYEKDNITLKNLCFIQPKILCKIMNEKKLLYEPMVISIIQYKSKYSIDFGFPATKYQEALTTYMRYSTNQKHISKIKRNEIVKEDYTDIFSFYSNNPNWEQVSEEQETMFVKKIKNKKFGKLTAKYPYKRIDIADPSIYWLCKCDCGSWMMLQKADLKHIHSCGCDSKENYVGQRHEHLECIEQTRTISKNGAKSFKLKVRCDCGNEKIMSVGKFKNSIYCGRWCGLADWSKDNGKRLKGLFYDDTNIAKLGKSNPNCNSSTGYLGVGENKKVGTYFAYISFKKKREHLGTYSTPEIAMRVRKEAQKILQGNCIDELRQDEFVQNNKYLMRLIERAEEKLKGLSQNV